MIPIIIISLLVITAVLLQIKEPSSQAKSLERILPLAKIEHDAILSKQGDITVAFRLELPEVFTLSNEDYESLHHVWVKAIKILPTNTVIHKQDWFTDASYKANFGGEEKSFLQLASERYFNERPYLDHSCYVMVTRKAPNRKLSSSVFSNLIRPSLFPKETLSGSALQEFMDRVSQFEKLLTDGGYIRVKRLTTAELVGTKEKPGLIERYCFLQTGADEPLVRDIVFKPEWQIGEHFCQLYTMSDVEDLPSLCGPRITYDKYSTERTKFSVSFAAPIGQLLNCNHIYNQFILIEDTPTTLKKLESKRRRLQSLAAYSRENAISRDATNAFLNEAISQQRQPVRAHFNIMAWTPNRDDLKDLRNRTSAAMAQMDATPRQEIKGAPQLYWAGLPGNEADLPYNECFQTFAEQATCFFNQETNYRSSVSPFGIRLGDRTTGRPVLVDISDEPMGKAITNRNKFMLGPSGGCRAA